MDVSFGRAEHSTSKGRQESPEKSLLLPLAPTILELLNTCFKQNGPRVASSPSPRPGSGITAQPRCHRPEHCSCSQGRKHLACPRLLAQQLSPWWVSLQFETIQYGRLLTTSF